MTFDPPPSDADAPPDQAPVPDADLEPQPKPGPEPTRPSPSTSGQVASRHDGLRLQPAGRGVADAPADIHGRGGLPGRGRVPAGDGGVGQPPSSPACDRGAEGRGPQPRAVESLPPRFRARGRPQCSRVRTARRDHRSEPRDRPRGHQLLGARHREHGDPPPVRHPRAEGDLARAVARWRVQVLLLDDRARCRQLGRHQHPHPDRPRRRRVPDHRVGSGSAQAPPRPDARCRS